MRLAKGTTGHGTSLVAMFTVNRIVHNPCVAPRGLLRLTQDLPGVPPPPVKLQPYNRVRPKRPKIDVWVGAWPAETKVPIALSLLSICAWSLFFLLLYLVTNDVVGLETMLARTPPPLLVFALANITFALSRALLILLSRRMSGGCQPAAYIVVWLLLFRATLDNEFKGDTVTGSQA